MTQETLSLIMQGAITLITGGTLGSVLTWYSGRQKRKLEYRSEIDSALENMQNTVDMLADKNNDLYAEILSLRGQMSDVLGELEYIKQIYEHETGKPAPKKAKRLNQINTSIPNE